MLYEIGAVMNKELITNSLNAHRIFSYFWNDSVIDCFEDNIELDFTPQEYMGIYQKRIEIPLYDLKKSSELSGKSAKAVFVLTSLVDEVFDINKAITNIDSDNANCAIFVMINIINEHNRTIFTSQFNLGSRVSEKIDADSEYLKRFSFLY